MEGVKAVTPALSDYYMLYDAADRRKLRAEVPANKGHWLKDACLMHYSPVLGRRNSVRLRALEGVKRCSDCQFNILKKGTKRL